MAAKQPILFHYYAIKPVMFLSEAAEPSLKVLLHADNQKGRN